MGLRNFELPPSLADESGESQRSTTRLVRNCILFRVLLTINSKFSLEYDLEELEETEREKL